jgi:hypothetical protein
MFEKVKQAIHVGRHVTDLMRLPCVYSCHKEVHCNPWRNIELMKAKAEELGIDLKERYDYGELRI